MQFHPLDPASLSLPRRALLPAMPAVARTLRWWWNRTRHSRSTWFDSRRWRSVWNVVRWVGAVPRQRPHLLQVRFAPGIVLELDLSRLTDVLALCYGPGENEVGHACRMLCPRDGVVADIGGNIGTTALAFAAAVPAGRVHVFEPSPPMLACLRRNIALSAAGNVTVHAIALGERTATAQLQVAIAGNPGSAYLGNEATPGATPVPVRRLDEALADVPRLDFVKVDSEGFELQALRGGEQTLRRHRPAVMFECNESALRRAGCSGSEVVAFLEGLGYRMHWLDGGRLRAYDAPTMLTRKLHNVVALPRERAVTDGRATAPA
ncbi:MAG: FkbM family methyltransferase [Planctomycetota bacterium]